MADHVNPQTGKPATHNLPISNGWSGGWSSETGDRPPTTWCGHCKASIPVTAAWVNRYYDKQLERFDYQVAGDRLRIQRERQLLLSRVSGAAS